MKIYSAPLHKNAVGALQLQYINNVKAKRTHN